MFLTLTTKKSSFCLSTRQLEKVSTVGKWETEVTYNKFGKKTSEESLR